MTPFQIAFQKLDPKLIADLITHHSDTIKEALSLPESHHVTTTDANAYVKQELQDQTVYLNDMYQVVVRQQDDLIHLSIKRIDRDIIHDWRELQEIKNQILGDEVEAVELYPAESRKVDSANQYHLWAIAQDGYRFPFGFADRLVTDVAIGQSKQRPITY